MRARLLNVSFALAMVASAASATGALAVPPPSVPPRPRSLPALEHAKARADSRLPAPSRRAAATPRTQLSGSVFAGIGATDNSAWAAFAPPDSTGAKGPSNYVEIVNSALQVFDGSGTPVGSPLDLQTFLIANGAPLQAHGSDPLTDPGDAIFDVQVQWDAASQRWLIAAADVSQDGATTHLVFGWSKSSDPDPTAWCAYRTTGQAAFQDFPKLGHDDSHLFIGSNEFASFLSNSFLAARLFSIPTPSSAPITGACPAMPTVTEGTMNGAFSPVPANIADPSSKGYVVAVPATGPQDHLLLYAISAAGAIDSTATSVPIPAWGTPPGVQQPGSPLLIDSQDGRLTQAVAHADPNASGDETVWTQHAVASADGLRSEVRWYELDPSASASKLVQEGTIADPSNSVFNASISPAGDGSTAAIDYNVGGRFHLVQARAQTRVAGTPAGTMLDEHTLGTSQDVDADFTCTEVGGEPCRWGDYSGASPDPSDTTLVWATNQLNGAIQPAQAASWTTINFALASGGEDPPPDTTTDGFPFTSSSPRPVFNFASSETGSNFECSIDGSAFGSCTPGAAFGSALANGTHTFSVFAIDASGQRDSTPASATFTVVGPTPDTAIDSGPPSSTPSRSVRFSFHSSVAGSAFQCSIDGGAWVGCGSPFATPSLGFGSHWFQVRAIDPLGNADPTPALRLFTIIRQPKAAVTARSQRAGRGYRVSLRVRCPASRTVRCSGTVALTAGRLKLGSARFRVGIGRTVTVRVRLNAKARAQLRRRHRLRVKATFRLSSPSQKTTKTFTLTAPRKKPAHARRRAPAAHRR